MSKADHLEEQIKEFISFAEQHRETICNNDDSKPDFLECYGKMHNLAHYCGEACRGEPTAEKRRLQAHINYYEEDEDRMPLGSILDMGKLALAILEEKHSTE